jgi:hypothetical protein
MRHQRCLRSRVRAASPQPGPRASTSRRCTRR